MVDKPALVSLTFDDGLRCQFEQGLPILERYGFLATFFLVANTDPIHTDGFPHPPWSKTDWSEKDIRCFKNMIQQGHEIGSHSVHHRHPFLDDDPRLEAECSKHWIEGRLKEKITSYCYPCCHCTDPIKNAVIKAGYKQARSGANRIYCPEQRPTDFYKVNCRHIAMDNPDFVVIDGVSHPVGRDGAENLNGWLQPDWYVLMFHGIGTINDGWWPISVAEFTREMSELAKLRDSGAVEVVTFEDGADRLRQPSLH